MWTIRWISFDKCFRFYFWPLTFSVFTIFFVCYGMVRNAHVANDRHFAYKLNTDRVRTVCHVNTLPTIIKIIALICIDFFYIPLVTQTLVGNDDGNHFQPFTFQPNRVQNEKCVPTEWRRIGIILGTTFDSLYSTICFSNREWNSIYSSSNKKKRLNWRKRRRLFLARQRNELRHFNFNLIYIYADPFIFLWDRKFIDLLISHRAISQTLKK